MTPKRRGLLWAFMALPVVIVLPFAVAKYVDTHGQRKATSTSPFAVAVPVEWPGMSQECSSPGAEANQSVVECTFAGDVEQQLSGGVMSGGLGRPVTITDAACTGPYSSPEGSEPGSRDWTCTVSFAVKIAKGHWEQRSIDDTLTCVTGGCSYPAFSTDKLALPELPDTGGSGQ